MYNLKYTTKEQWSELHKRWCELAKLINRDGTFSDDANISELIDIEKKIWSCVLDFKEGGIEFPKSMKTFKPYDKLYEEQLTKQKKINSTTDIENIELEDRTDALWAIADDLRDRKNQGEFNTYVESYRWGATHYTQNGNPITAFKLERAYHKAKSEDKVD